MKRVIKLFVAGIAVVLSINAYAQDARALVNEGISLNNARQYAGAIEKYKAALQLEPGNTNANYQMAFSLKAMGKAADAMPYLQKVVTADASPAVMASAYSLMGNIYEQTAQLQKAIDSYRQAVNADTANYSHHYNLGLAYFRARQYNQAEKSALSALTIEPKHQESIRLYALVTFHQNKRAPALLALCRYLSLAPTDPSSAEAYGNMQSILKGGTLKTEPGAKAPVADSRNRELNQAITAAVNTVDKRKYTAAATLLSSQLSAVFMRLGPLTEKQTRNDAFFTTLAARYYKLAQTDSMPAFANFISQSVDKAAAAWVKTHGDMVSSEW